MRTIVPGGYLLIAAFIARSYPRSGGWLLILAGLLGFFIFKGATSTITMFSAGPPLLTGLALLIRRANGSEGEVRKE